MILSQPSFLCFAVAMTILSMVGPSFGTYNRHHRLQPPKSIITDKIDQLEDDVTLRKVEQIMVLVLGRLTHQQCNACFGRYQRLKDYCIGMRVERRVEMLNSYRCSTKSFR